MQVNPPPKEANMSTVEDATTAVLQMVVASRLGRPRTRIASNEVHVSLHAASQGVSALVHAPSAALSSHCSRVNGARPVVDRPGAGAFCLLMEPGPSVEPNGMQVRVLRMLSVS